MEESEAPTVKWNGWRARATAGLVVALVATGLVLLDEGAPTAAADVPCAGGSVFNVVPHQDDDLLFMSPTLADNVGAAAADSTKCLQTVFVTAGDGGAWVDVWESREAGARAAYAQMAGVANAWTVSDAGVTGHPAIKVTLTAKPNISLVYLRLPDGGIDNKGSATWGSATVSRLWRGTSPQIVSNDTSGVGPAEYQMDSTTYTKQGLIDALLSLMQTAAATKVYTTDVTGTAPSGDVTGDPDDHPDHFGVAQFAQAAHQVYATAHHFTSYTGYASQSQDPNVTGAPLTAKQNTFFTYSQSDDAVCNSVSDCQLNGGGAYLNWLERQYVAYEVEQTTPTTTSTTTTSTTTTSTTTTSTTTTSTTTTTVAPTTTTTVAPPTTAAPTPAPATPQLTAQQQEQLTAFFNFVVWVRFLAFCKAVLAAKAKAKAKAKVVKVRKR